MKKKSLNKLQRRDKKRNPYTMRVDTSARTLAEIKKRRLLRKRRASLGLSYPVKSVVVKKKLTRAISPYIARSVKVITPIPARIIEPEASKEELQKMVKAGKLHQKDLDVYLERQ